MHAEEDEKREIQLLEEAVTLDSTFAMAWRRLGVKLARGDGDFSNERMERGKAALRRAYALRDRLSPVERGLTEATYFSAVENDQRRAAAAYLAILNEQPGNRIALNNLANMSLQDGMFERVREYGNRYVALDSSNFDAWPWTIWGAYGTGRVDEARAARAAMRARFKSPDEVIKLDEMDLQWLNVERDWPGVEKLARRLLTSAREPHRVDMLTRSLMTSLAMRGLLEESWQVNDSLGAQRLLSPDSSERRVWRGDAARQRYFDRGWYGGDTAGIGRAIQTYIAESGVDRWKMEDRPMFNLLFDFVLAGDGKGARARLNAYRAEAARLKGRGKLPPVSSPILASLEGQVLLAEHRPREALGKLLPLAPEALRFPQPETFHIGMAYLDLGQRDSARTWLSRVTDSPDPRRAWTEASFRGRALQLLCQLADTPAQRQQWCQALATEWKDADPFLQPIVARARARLAE